jgi:hypothetical protein
MIFLPHNEFNIDLNIQANLFNNIKYKNFDLIIGGGGFRGYYHIGSLYLLKQLEQNNQINVRQIVGTSSGAIAAVNYACDVDFNEWLESYENIKNLMKNGYDLHLATIKLLKEKLPQNAHELCNACNVKIVTSKLKWNYLGFTEVIFNNFESFNHLIDCISAAINIPFYTSDNFSGVIINSNRHYDGFFCRLTPIITNNDYPQLVIKTANVLYPTFATLKPKDSHINLLAIRGFLETNKFLKNQSDKNKVIQWIDPHTNINKNKSSKLLQFVPTNYKIIVFPITFYLIGKYLQK